MSTDSTGAVVRTFGNYPFGETWYETGAANKWKFTSYERDSESSLDYAMFRFDSSRLGRFQTPDPLAGTIWNPQSLNRYTYVVNNPVNLVDPFGLSICPPGCTARIISEVPEVWHCDCPRDPGNSGFDASQSGRGGCYLDGFQLPDEFCFGKALLLGTEDKGGVSPVNPCIITSQFGPDHPRGIDITTADWRDNISGGGPLSGYGTPVRSPVTGVVARVGTDKSGANFVTVSTSSQQWTFRHISSPLIPGMSVSAGLTILGATDTSGNQTAAHVHVEVKNSKGNLVNPAPLLPYCTPAKKP